MGLFDGTALERPVHCDRCGLDVKVCRCEPLAEGKRQPEVPPAKQRLKIRIEKRKRGKVVTVVAGFSGSALQRQQVLSQLKNQCGAGGTINEECIEIQGDHGPRVRQQLTELGFKTT